MRNSVKTLIVGVVLAEVAFGAYLLSPKSDPSTDSPDGTTSRASALSSNDVELDDSHVIAGNVVRAPASANNVATNNSVPTPAESVAGRMATATDPSSGYVAQALQPTVSAQPDVAMAPAAKEPISRVHGPDASLAATDSKAIAAPQGPVTRDSLRRHNSNPVATAMTDQLVKESAGLDPNLPPPDPSLRTSTPRRSSNPVADAMTDQLVRESSRLDPSLPPPNPANTR